MILKNRNMFLILAIICINLSAEPTEPFNQTGETATAFQAPSDRVPNALSLFIGMPYADPSEYGFMQIAVFASYQRIFGRVGFEIALGRYGGEISDDDSIYSTNSGDYVDLSIHLLRLKSIYILGKKGRSSHSGFMFYALGDLTLSQTTVSAVEDGEKRKEWDFSFLKYRPTEMGLGFGFEYNFWYLPSLFLEAGFGITLPYHGYRISSPSEWSSPVEICPRLEGGLRIRF